MSLIKRRRFLSWFLGAFTGTIWSSRSWASNQTAFLKDYAAQNNFLYGAATQYSILRRDKDFASCFVKDSLLSASLKCQFYVDREGYSAGTY